jgi:hypothetical protein
MLFDGVAQLVLRHQRPSLDAGLAGGVEELGLRALLDTRVRHSGGLARVSRSAASWWLT